MFNFVENYYSILRCDKTFIRGPAWVVVVVHALEAGGAQRRQQQRHNDEIPGLGAHRHAQPVEQTLQRVVHNLQRKATHFNRRACHLYLTDDAPRVTWHLYGC
jgi:hypothetical protein